MASVTSLKADLGEYLREQRHGAKLSLRQLADLAGVSNPYLSQIERGLKKPSAEILQQLAKGLRISAESLYVRAGILDEQDDRQVETKAAILADSLLAERQKRVLLDIYDAFCAENLRAAGDTAGAQPGRTGEAADAADSDSASAADTSADDSADDSADRRQRRRQRRRRRARRSRPTHLPGHADLPLPDHPHDDPEGILMNLVDDFRGTATTPVYAVVGITDLAVEAARRAQARAVQARADLEPAALQIHALHLQARAQRVPVAAVSLGMETAARAEERYGELAERGRTLVERIRRQRSTQDLIEQSKVTISRGKAVVTTVRKVVDETVPAVRATARTAQRDAADVAEDTRESARTRTRPTRKAAKRTASTATKRTRTAKSTTRSATTSARKTASKAASAGSAAASKVGD